LYHNILLFKKGILKDNPDVKNCITIEKPEELKYLFVQNIIENQFKNTATELSILYSFMRIDVGNNKKKMIDVSSELLLENTIGTNSHHII